MKIQNLLIISRCEVFYSTIPMSYMQINIIKYVTMDLNNKFILGLAGVIDIVNENYSLLID